jgi:DNA-binding Lrp family transcriptional regulator
MTATATSVSIDDPVNRAILAVSEDQLTGFQPDPIRLIAERSGIAAETVIERLRVMLESGTIRRIRQTLLSTNLAAGALVAWEVPEDDLSAAFDYMFERDPFSGHVVLRSTDTVISGSHFRLWTTVKVPQGFSLEKHCQWLAKTVGARQFRIMPAKAVFALGVGHVRRREMIPGARSEEPSRVITTRVVALSDREWRVLTALKREFEPAELCIDLWAPRAAEAGVSREEFFEVARSLEGKGVIGRFSTFLEHVKQLSTGERVTRYNALFHWQVPPGREMEAGMEVGRHEIMTHAYWREGGPEFANVNVMGVAHGMEKDLVLAHKAAIDGHLQELGIPVAYTNVFWGGRSEIKPSEVSPLAYAEWCETNGIDPETMRANPAEEDSNAIPSS